MDGLSNAAPGGLSRFAQYRRRKTTTDGHGTFHVNRDGSTAVVKRKHNNYMAMNKQFVFKRGWLEWIKHDVPARLHGFKLTRTILTGH